MGLVMQMAQALWRLERFNHMQESLAVKHLEKAQQGKKLLGAMLCISLDEQIERLKSLFVATCMGRGLESSVGPEEMKVFEKCREDVPENTAKEILRLLLRLRKPGAPEELDPGLRAQVGEVPVAEGEERTAAGRDLTRVLAREIEALEKRFLQEEDPDEARAQFDRDEILAKAQPHAALMNRGEESSLRQVWRTAQLLIEIKKAAQKQKDVKNEDCSQ
jgi:hypothetical protein